MKKTSSLSGHPKKRAFRSVSHPDHSHNLVSLRRIEGQIRGVQRMINERRYCVDILIQIDSVIGAIVRVQDQIFQTHLGHCFANTLKQASTAKKEKRIGEIMMLLKKFRKNA